MPPEIKGKVIIRAIPDAAVREKVVAFICSHGAHATPDQVAARLNRLPLVLAGSIEAAKGERLAGILTGLGAAAAFVAGDGDQPPGAPPTGEAGSGPAATEQSPTAVIRPGGSDRSARKKPVPDDGAEKQRIALACRIALIYALLACLVAMASPLFYIFAIPLALYASHRAAALLEVDIWLRAFYLPGMFVPLLNLFLLCLLLLQTHLFLRRRKLPVDLPPDELAPLRTALRFTYAAFMAIFLIGSANGFLPEAMGELRETVERRLEKEVARAAKQFPRSVDKDLRIDRMSAGPDKRLTFHCTLLNYRAKALDAERFRTTIIANVVKEVCGSKEMKYYLNKDVVIAYAFSGNDAQPITTVDVANADCER